MRRKSFLLVWAAAILLAAPASAGRIVETTVTIGPLCGNGACENNPDVWRAHGKATSPRQRCQARRLVEIYNSSQGPGDRLLGTDRTNSRGRWRFRRPSFNPSSIAYYAKAPRVVLDSGIVCSPDRSGSRHWGHGGPLRP